MSKCTVELHLERDDPAFTPGDWRDLADPFPAWGQRRAA